MNILHDWTLVNQMDHVEMKIVTSLLYPKYIFYPRCNVGFILPPHLHRVVLY